jgi:polar amino acid transport system substrate-binding protein
LRQRWVMYKNLCCLLLVVLFTACVQSARAEELKLAVGLTLPPFVFSESDTGIDLEIVQESLASKGYSVKPVYVVFGRTAIDLKTDKVDGALTVSRERGIDNIYLSDEYICYQNVAVALQSKGFQVNSLKDLAGKRITAFQDATKILGPDFLAAAESSSSYYEIPDQENQVALLFKDRADIIILDLNIFKYYQQNSKRVDTTKPVDYFAVFPPSCFSVGFKSVKIRDDFNAGLKELRASGRYDEIFRKYIK